MEGQLEIADKYDEMLVEKGIKPGKMGLSTGVPPHLVRTEQKGGAEHIKTAVRGGVDHPTASGARDTRAARRAEGRRGHAPKGPLDPFV